MPLDAKEATKAFYSLTCQPALFSAKLHNQIQVTVHLYPRAGGGFMWCLWTGRWLTPRSMGHELRIVGGDIVEAGNLDEVASKAVAAMFNADRKGAN